MILSVYYGSICHQNIALLSNVKKNLRCTFIKQDYKWLTFTMPVPNQSEPKIKILNLNCGNRRGHHNK
jgi:hypothetical protein